jgi:hypothetical protein
MSSTAGTTRPENETGLSHAGSLQCAPGFVPCEGGRRWNKEAASFSAVKVGPNSVCR